MTKKICVLLAVILSLILIGVLIADIYVSGQITKGITEIGSEASKEWNQIQSDRFITLIAFLFFGSCILAIVLKIGSDKAVMKRVSQDEAIRIADEIMASDKANDIFVEASDETENEMITEMARPTVTSLRCEKGYVVIEWTSVPNATGYSIWRKKEKDEWKRVKKFNKPSYYFEDHTVEQATKYAYAVRAFYAAEGVLIASRRDYKGLDICIPAENQVGKEEE